MGDGRINRAIEQGRARTSDLKERVPELKERGTELRERVPELGSELRTRGTELRARGAELARHYKSIDVSWARYPYARAAREALLSGVLGPLIDWYVKRRAEGTDLFDRDLAPPVIFVANHSSHLDTPTILRSMPRKWRSRTVVAAAADYFYKKRWSAYGVALLINTVPLGRTGGGLSEGATDHVDGLIEDRWNLLMFPEGTRSRDGKIGKIRSGAAVIAANHGIDIVPIYVSGTHEAMPPGQSWPKRLRGRPFPRRHRAVVKFGDPIPPRDPSQRRDVMAEVQAFWERKGEPLEPRPPVAIHDVLLIHEVLRAHELAAERDGARRFEPVHPLVAEPVPDQPSPAA